MAWSLFNGLWVKIQSTTGLDEYMVDTGDGNTSVDTDKIVKNILKGLGLKRIKELEVPTVSLDKIDGADYTFTYEHAYDIQKYLREHSVGLSIFHKFEQVRDISELAIYCVKSLQFIKEFKGKVDQYCEDFLPFKSAISVQKIVDTKRKIDNDAKIMSELCRKYLQDTERFSFENWKKEKAKKTVEITNELKKQKDAEIKDLMQKIAEAQEECRKNYDDVKKEIEALQGINSNSKGLLSGLRNVFKSWAKGSFKDELKKLLESAKSGQVFDIGNIEKISSLVEQISAPEEAKLKADVEKCIKDIREVAVAYMSAAAFEKSIKTAQTEISRKISDLNVEDLMKYKMSGPMLPDYVRVLKKLVDEVPAKVTNFGKGEIKIDYEKLGIPQSERAGKIDEIDRDEDEINNKISLRASKDIAKMKKDAKKQYDKFRKKLKSLFIDLKKFIELSHNPYKGKKDQSKWDAVIHKEIKDGKSLAASSKNFVQQGLDKELKISKRYINVDSLEPINLSEGEVSKEINGIYIFLVEFSEKKQTGQEFLDKFVQLNKEVSVALKNFAGLENNIKVLKRNYKTEVFKPWEKQYKKEKADLSKIKKLSKSKKK